MRRVRVRVTGRVQGVGFRFHAEELAARLGIHGWVRNCDDRTVEAEIEGPEPQLQQMLDWLAQGPPPARVLRMVTTDVATTGGEGFTILPSV